MDPVLWIILALVIGAMVAAIAWFGPMRKQWKTHDGHATPEGEPLDTLPDDVERTEE